MVAECGKNFKREENRGRGAWLSLYLKQMHMIKKKKKKKEKKEKKEGHTSYTNHLLYISGN